MTITGMVYDKPLEYVWKGALQHLKFNELGELLLPLTNVVETSGRYYLIAENTKELRKTIYAAIDISGFPMMHGLRFGYDRVIGGKRFIMIPVLNEDQADAVFYVWEGSFKNDAGLVAATSYILDTIERVGY
jgi:hypothetical protein